MKTIMKPWTYCLAAAGLLCLSAGLFAAGAAQAFDLALAKKLAAKAGEHAVKNGWKISIAVVNSEGNLVYFERADGAFPGSIEAAIEKAKSANAYRRPTKVFSDSVKQGNTGIVTLKNVVAVEGGLPIVLEGLHAGAIGISGARAAEDEACAQAALN
ncbi:MAG: heme-binding protein [Elusimicrobiota bacterium]|nr:heme-binding protein [Elusimicrobiota bacterium]